MRRHRVQALLLDRLSRLGCRPVAVDVHRHRLLGLADIAAVEAVEVDVRLGEDELAGVADEGVGRLLVVQADVAQGLGALGAAQATGPGLGEVRGRADVAAGEVVQDLLHGDVERTAARADLAEVDRVPVAGRAEVDLVEQLGRQEAIVDEFAQDLVALAGLQRKELRHQRIAVGRVHRRIVGGGDGRGRLRQQMAQEGELLLLVDRHFPEVGEVRRPRQALGQEQVADDLVDPAAVEGAQEDVAEAGLAAAAQEARGVVGRADDERDLGEVAVFAGPLEHLEGGHVLELLGEEHQHDLVGVGVDHVVPADHLGGRQALGRQHPDEDLAVGMDMVRDQDLLHGRAFRMRGWRCGS